MTQTCDFTPSHEGDAFICEVYGLGANPAQCCKLPNGAMIMCSDAGYSTAPQASDFANCAKDCSLGNTPTVAPTNAPPAPTASTVTPPAPTGTTAAPIVTIPITTSQGEAAVPVFPLHLLLLNILDEANAFFTNTEGVGAALIKAIAASFDIDATRVAITKIWEHVPGTETGRRLTSKDIGVSANINNPAGDVTPAKADSARGSLAGNMNSQLQAAGINATVSSVVAGPDPLLLDPVTTTVAPANPCGTAAPATTAPATAAPASPCGTAAPTATVTPAVTQTTTPAVTQTTTPVSNPCATGAPVAKDAVHPNAKSAMQPTVDIPTSTLMIAMCFLATCIVVGVGIRVMQRKTRQSRQYKPMSELAIASDIEDQVLE